MSMHCQFCRLQNQSIPNPGPIYRQSVVDPAHRTSVQGKSAIFFLPILYQSDANAVPILFQSIANPKQICQANENPGLICQSIFNGVPIHCQSNVNMVQIRCQANVNPDCLVPMQCRSLSNPMSIQSQFVANTMSINCQCSANAVPISFQFGADMMPTQ